MTSIWIWRITEYEPPGDTLARIDVTGFDVDATDGHIGKVDEATDDAGLGLLVVDTGFWIFGKKRLVPAGMVDRVDVGGRRVQLACTKDEVKDAPDYDEVRRDEQAYRDEVGGHYERLRGDPIAPMPGTEPHGPQGLHGDPIGPVAGTGEPPPR